MPFYYWPDNPTLQNYANVFSSSDFPVALRISAIVGVSVTIIALVIGPTAARRLAALPVSGPHVHAVPHLVDVAVSASCRARRALSVITTFQSAPDADALILRI